MLLLVFACCYSSSHLLFVFFALVAILFHAYYYSFCVCYYSSSHVFFLHLLLPLLFACYYCSWCLLMFLFVLVFVLLLLFALVNIFLCLLLFLFVFYYLFLHLLLLLYVHCYSSGTCSFVVTLLHVVAPCVVLSPSSLYHSSPFLLASQELGVDNLEWNKAFFNKPSIHLIFLSFFLSFFHFFSFVSFIGFFLYLFLFVVCCVGLIINYFKENKYFEQKNWLHLFAYIFPFFGLVE